MEDRPTPAVAHSVPLRVPLKPMERLHFRSELTAIGDFICPPSHTLFRDSGPSLTHSFSFPRTSTEIQPLSGRSYVEGPDLVSIFARGEAYRQRRVTPEGSRTDWFVVADDVLADAVARGAPESFGGSASPFGASHFPCSDEVYLRQRRIVNAARSRRVGESDVEEAVLRLLEDVIRLLRRAQGARTEGAGRAARPELVDGAKAILAETYTRALPLSEISRELDVSVSYLCRVFRDATGLTLSDYRRVLRLRTALESVADKDLDLAVLAIELGFSSPSHFTFAFRRAFRLTPSLFRRAERDRLNSAAVGGQSRDTHAPPRPVKM